MVSFKKLPPNANFDYDITKIILINTCKGAKKIPSSGLGVSYLGVDPRREQQVKFQR